MFYNSNRYGGICWISFGKSQSIVVTRFFFDAPIRLQTATSHMYVCTRDPFQTLDQTSLICRQTLCPILYWSAGTLRRYCLVGTHHWLSYVTGTQAVVFLECHLHAFTGNIKHVYKFFNSYWNNWIRSSLVYTMVCGLYDAESLFDLSFIRIHRITLTLNMRGPSYLALTRSIS